MIDAGSIRHRGLRELAKTGRSGFIPAALLERIRNRLAVLESMRSVRELPPSYRAHQLAGRRHGTWSIRVNGPWRMTFRFHRETVFDLDLEQYH